MDDIKEKLELIDRAIKMLNQEADYLGKATLKLLDDGSFIEYARSKLTDYKTSIDSLKEYKKIIGKKIED